MPLNDDLLARMVSHQIGLTRLATGVVNRIIELLDSMDSDLVDQLTRRADTTSWTSARINALLDDIRRINREVYRTVQRELRTELANLAEYEVEYQREMLDDTLPVRLAWRVPTRNQILAAALEEPFQGGLLQEWVAGMEAGRFARLREAVRIGFAEGESIDKIVRRVRGTASAGYKDGVLEISRRSAASMVRTAVNHTATAARERLYEENTDLVSRIEWVSTLDLRTTPICRARDGRTWPVGEGPRPPAHIACRSTTVPVVRSWRELGIDLDEAPPGTRASMDGQVAADLTYAEWLRTRSAAEQDEVLGKTKGRLFRAGGLTMDKFVDSTGRAYTLDELRRRERAAWRRAGLGREAA